MYDYDYEREPNYPEVEEIIENATGEFSKFLHDTFVDEYKNIETAKQNNNAKEKALNERSNSLSERERELRDRETALSKLEKERYAKFKSEWFTELGLNFDIGDTVYYYKDITKQITCPTCNGTRRVKAKIESISNMPFESEIWCPTCNYGKISGEKEYDIIEAKVSEIKAYIHKKKAGDVNVESYDWSDDLSTYVWVRNKKDNDSKKISGEKLYKTKEEAERRIAELKGEGV